MTQQLTLRFEDGLTSRFRTLRECVAATVHACARPMKSIAADCDLSVSELSRRLNEHPDDPRTLPVDLMVQIMDSTGDLRPIHWLIERFMRDADSQRAAAMDQIAALLPQLQSLIDAAGAKGKRR